MDRFDEELGHLLLNLVYITSGNNRLLENLHWDHARAKNNSLVIYLMHLL